MNVVNEWMNRYLNVSKHIELQMDTLINNGCMDILQMDTLINNGWMDVLQIDTLINNGCMYVL